MTRKEAIEIFKNMLDAWDNYYTIAQSDKKREAVWLAISSLETDEAYQLEYERTTKNDLSVDCTEKSNAINIIQDMHGLARADVISDAVNRIIELPSITPQESKTGHWIDDTRLGYHVSICSNCGWRGHGDTCLIYKPKYCPNCGCHMVEPQESEDKE